MITFSFEEALARLRKGEHVRELGHVGYFFIGKSPTTGKEVIMTQRDQWRTVVKAWPILKMLNGVYTTA